MFVYVCMCVYIVVCLCLCVYIVVCLCLFVCIYSCMFVFVCVHFYVYYSSLFVCGYVVCVVLSLFCP